MFVGNLLGNVFSINIYGGYEGIRIVEGRVELWLVKIMVLVDFVECF